MRIGSGPDAIPFWRSGDLAPIGDDGLWVHRGRVDLLVKIRGKLVEPVEPERVLAEVPWLRGSVVMPHTLPGGALRLVAHLEPVEGAELNTDELRSTLRRRFPRIWCRACSCVTTRCRSPSGARWTARRSSPNHWCRCARARLNYPVMTDQQRSLARLNRVGSRRLLWMLAGAGGSALALRALTDELGDDQPVMVLEARAVHERGRIDPSVQSAARRHLATIRAEQPEGPYVVAGHSAGGLITYEIAQLLHAAGDEVVAVVIDAPPGKVAKRVEGVLLPDGAIPPRTQLGDMSWLDRRRHGATAQLMVAATVCG